MATQSQTQAGINRPATRDDIRHVLGNIDDSLVVKILAKQPSFVDLKDAAIWVRGDGDWTARENQELSTAALAVAKVLARDDDSQLGDDA